MKKIIIGIIVIVLIVLVGLGIMILNNSKAPTVTADCATGVTTITYTPQKLFSPACIKVPSGTTVTYQNQSSGKLKVGADPHPIHTGNKEVSNGQFTLDIEPGASGKTTVSKKGTFGFHDHQHASARGTIVVE